MSSINHKFSALHLDRYIELNEIARLFHVSPRTIRRWSASRKGFPRVVIKPTRKTSLYLREDLIRYCQSIELAQGEIDEQAA